MAHRPTGFWLSDNSENEPRLDYASPAFLSKPVWHTNAHKLILLRETEKSLKHANTCLTHILIQSGKRTPTKIMCVCASQNLSWSSSIKKSGQIFKNITMRVSLWFTERICNILINSSSSQVLFAPYVCNSLHCGNTTRQNLHFINTVEPLLNAQHGEWINHPIAQKNNPQPSVSVKIHNDSIQIFLWSLFVPSYSVHSKTHLHRASTKHI